MWKKQAKTPPKLDFKEIELMRKEKAKIVKDKKIVSKND